MVEFYSGVPGQCGETELCVDNHPVCDTQYLTQSVGGWCGDADHYLGGTCRTGKLVSSLDPALTYDNPTCAEYFVKQPCNLPKVNYLLNAQNNADYTCGVYQNNVDITWKEWQRAIWWLIHSETTCGCGAGGYNSSVVQCLLGEANEHSDWYPTKCSDVFAAILVPLPDCTCESDVLPTNSQSTSQEIIIPVTLTEWGCPCVTETAEETAMAFNDMCPDASIRPNDLISDDGKSCLITGSPWKPYFEYCCELYE
jgi:hypothetical protein